jgi:hypothetical protein
MKRFYFRIFLIALAFGLLAISVYRAVSQKESNSVIIVTPRYRKEMWRSGGGG